MFVDRVPIQELHTNEPSKAEQGDFGNEELREELDQQFVAGSQSAAQQIRLAYQESGEWKKAKDFGGPKSVAYIDRLTGDFYIQNEDGVLVNKTEEYRKSGDAEKIAQLDLRVEELKANGVRDFAQDKIFSDSVKAKREYSPAEFGGFEFVEKIEGNKLYLGFEGYRKVKAMEFGSIEEVYDAVGQKGEGWAVKEINTERLKLSATPSEGKGKGGEKEAIWDVLREKGWHVVETEERGRKIQKLYFSDADGNIGYLINEFKRTEEEIIGIESAETALEVADDEDDSLKAAGRFGIGLEISADEPLAGRTSQKTRAHKTGALDNFWSGLFKNRSLEGAVGAGQESGVINIIEDDHETSEQSANDIHDKISNFLSPKLSLAAESYAIGPIYLETAPRKDSLAENPAAPLPQARTALERQAVRNAQIEISSEKVPGIVSESAIEPKPASGEAQQENAGFLTLQPETQTSETLPVQAEILGSNTQADPGYAERDIAKTAYALENQPITIRTSEYAETMEERNLSKKNSEPTKEVFGVLEANDGPEMAKDEMLIIEPVSDAQSFRIEASQNSNSSLKTGSKETVTRPGFAETSENNKDLMPIVLEQSSGQAQVQTLEQKVAPVTDEIFLSKLDLSEPFEQNSEISKILQIAEPAKTSGRQNLSAQNANKPAARTIFRAAAAKSAIPNKSLLLKPTEAVGNQIAAKEATPIELAKPASDVLEIKSGAARKEVVRTPQRRQNIAQTENPGRAEKPAASPKAIESAILDIPKTYGLKTAEILEALAGLRNIENKAFSGNGVPRRTIESTGADEKIKPRSKNLSEKLSSAKVAAQKMQPAPALLNSADTNLKKAIDLAA